MQSIGGACALCIGICLPLGAQPYPAKPVMLIVPPAAAGTPEQLNTMLRRDRARWAGVVKASGARLD